MEKKGTIILVIILIIVIAIAGVSLYYKTMQNKNSKKEENEIANSNNVEQIEDEPLVIQKEEKKVQIFNGDDRPIAVMIDNHTGAWPHGGLNQAYLVYEIIVEGSETRLMALFKGVDVEKIGPVRSSRHYFLDYALENDAIYVHYGWSPQAESDISRYKVNNINGISESSKSFWRTKDKSSPHNVATSLEKIKEIAKRKKYSTISKQESVLNYVTDEVELEKGILADTVIIPHSSAQKVEYKYNEETGRYTRYARNKLQTDWSTGEEVTTKNIIITFCDNYTLQDSENKGRQGLTNIGTFDGYYITNGKAIQIKCTKTSRTEQTVYNDLEGNEIEVNDGNTFIHICPKKADVKIEGIEKNIVTENNM